MIILETSRLTLREMVVSDAEDIYHLNYDPEVIKYTGDPAFKSIKESKSFLTNYSHYRDYGFGRWAVIRKSDQAFLGWCGLKFSPELNEYDIGFRLFRKYWNMGYASEASRACIEWGFDSKSLVEIVGRARAKNGVSIRVLEKIGLVYKKRIPILEGTLQIYTITKSEFDRKKNSS